MSLNCTFKGNEHIQKIEIYRSRKKESSKLIFSQAEISRDILPSYLWIWIFEVAEYSKLLS